MRTVDVGVGHQDDLVITQLADIEVVFADAGAESVISDLISLWPSILSKRAFLDVQNLALSGRMAWFFRSRPCLAEPPAESLDDVDFDSAGSRSWQSASLPGSMVEPIAPCEHLRALRAASRARAASSAFPTIFLATGGFCSKNSVRRSFRNDSTAPFTSN